MTAPLETWCYRTGSRGRALGTTARPGLAVDLTPTRASSQAREDSADRSGSTSPGRWASMSPNTVPSMWPQAFRMQTA
jgi:hypothetical protein